MISRTTLCRWSITCAAGKLPKLDNAAGSNTEEDSVSDMNLTASPSSSWSYESATTLSCFGKRFRDGGVGRGGRLLEGLSFPKLSSPLSESTDGASWGDIAILGLPPSSASESSDTSEPRAAAKLSARARWSIIVSSLSSSSLPSSSESSGSSPSPSSPSLPCAWRELFSSFPSSFASADSLLSPLSPSCSLSDWDEPCSLFSPSSKIGMSFCPSSSLS